MHPYSLFTTTNLVICFHHLPSRQWLRGAVAAIRVVYRFISADELERFFYGGQRFNSRCLLRFDDGDRSFYDHAFPVLKDLSVPAVLFVSPQVLSRGANYWFQDMVQYQRLLPDVMIKKTIGAVTGRPIDELQNFGVLSICKSLPVAATQKILGVLEKHAGARLERNLNIGEKELQEISRSGTITVGAHTLNHPILANEDAGVAAAEIGQSLSGLSRMLQKEIRHFAYPNGLRGFDYGERETAILKDQGVRLAYSGETGFFGRQTDPYRIPCLGLSGDSGAKKLRITAKFLLAPVWDNMRADKEARERISIQKLWSKPGRSSVLPETPNNE